MNRLRVHLPLLLALSANSPFRARPLHRAGLHAYVALPGLPAHRHPARLRVLRRLGRDRRAHAALRRVPRGDVPVVGRARPAALRDGRGPCDGRPDRGGPGGGAGRARPGPRAPRARGGLRDAGRRSPRASCWPRTASSPRATAWRPSCWTPTRARAARHARCWHPCSTRSARMRRTPARRGTSTSSSTASRATRASAPSPPPAAGRGPSWPTWQARFRPSLGRDDRGAAAAAALGLGRGERAPVVQPPDGGHRPDRVVRLRIEAVSVARGIGERRALR